jgi:hypothetical protein
MGLVSPLTRGTGPIGAAPQFQRSRHERSQSNPMASSAAADLDVRARNVRFGSKADIDCVAPNVRFGPGARGLTEEAQTLPVVFPRVTVPATPLQPRYFSASSL